ncbi:MAG: aminotransferase class IV [Spirochaetaceae bacterium]
MTGAYYGKNGAIRPVSEAVVSLDDINFAYGYGVYETLKVRHGVVYFPDRHAERLISSAAVIGLEHPFDRRGIEGTIVELTRANGLRDANMKLLLIGPPEVDDPSGATLYAFMLNPYFPPRNLYRNGAAAVSVEAERRFPQSKSLDMLSSTIAYRGASRAGAYDALLTDREGRITEGTRTNLFYTDGTTLYEPPAATSLLGVTRLTLREMLGRQGVEVLERPLLRSEVGTFAGYFLTSTSSKVLPLARIDSHRFEIPGIIRRVMRDYDAFLEEYRAGQPSVS